MPPRTPVEDVCSPPFRRIPNMLFREHRTRAAGVADLLNWGFLVDHGVMLQKDGSLLAGWSYRGPDSGAATTAELAHVAQHVNDALLPLTDQWMLHIDAVRRPALPYSIHSFPNTITSLMDAERREAYHTHGAHFETDYVCLVSHTPPPELFTKLSRWFMRGEPERRREWSRVLTGFQHALDAIQQRLATVLTMHRLDSEALLTHLHRDLTGLSHTVAVPPHGSYLNTVLSDQELVGGFEPRIGTHHLRVVAVQGFPHASQMGQLERLTSLPYAYRWSTRIIPLSPSAASPLLRRHQLQWFKKRKGASAWIQEMTSRQQPTASATADHDAFRDQDAERMVVDAGTAVAENNAGHTRFCFTTHTVIVMDPDAQHATHVANEMMHAFHDSGFPARIETVNAIEAFLGSLPGHGSPNVRRPLLSSANVVDLLPITSVWPGHATTPSSLFPPQSPPVLWATTEGSTPFRLTLHEGDVGHTLIIGRTGAGKSTLVGLLTAQFQRFPKARVFVFDVGYSAWALSQAAGAPHYDIAAPDRQRLAFQPLAQIDHRAEQMWATEWLEMLLHLQGVTPTPAHRTRLYSAITLLAKNAVEHRTMTELLVHLQQPELIAALKPYTVGGVYADLLDASHDAITASTSSTARYCVFELQHLMEMDDRIVIPVALYLFHRMEQQLDGSPTLIVFEELWAALMKTIFADKIKQWLLTLRKRNAAVLLVAHSVGQLANTPHRHVLIESCPTRIFLPNPDATSSETALQYADLGVNAREIAIIARATPKRHYYLTSPSGRRLVELGLGPLALSLLATPDGMTANDVRRRIRDLTAQHGRLWPVHWLRDRGLPTWANRFIATEEARTPTCPDPFSA